MWCSVGFFFALVHYCDHWTDIVVERAKSADGVSEYSMWLHNQNTIFDEREDLAALRSGLQQLHRLKRITVLDQFDHPLDYHPFQWHPREFEYFLSWSDKSFRSVANPIAWSTAYCHDNWQNSLAESEWDFRGIDNLLTAIEEQAPQLRHSSFGCQRSWLPTSVFARRDGGKALRKILCQLVGFTMHCVPFEQASLEPEDCLGAATDMIREAKHLESLTLTVDYSKTDWARLSNRNRRSGLKILDLCAGEIDPQALRALLVAHEESLLELRLRTIYLTGGCSWEEVSGELGGHLNLRCITLMCVRDESGYTWSHKWGFLDRRDVKTAINFMKRTPDQLQKIASAGVGLVMAWNSEKFRPKFDLERYCDHFYSREEVQ